MNKPGTNDFQIVAYGREHVKQVFAIEAELNPEPWSEQLFTDELTVPETSRHWLVALGPEGVVGYAGSMLIGTEAHLMNIGVKPTQQRRGIAKSLMLTMLADIARKGLVDMTLEVRPDNTAAISMYQKFGFAPNGVRKAYYPDGQDAMIMWLHDLNSSAYGDRLKEMAS